MEEDMQQTGSMQQLELLIVAPVLQIRRVCFIYGDFCMENTTQVFKFREHCGARQKCLSFGGHTTVLLRRDSGTLMLVRFTWTS